MIKIRIHSLSEILEITKNEETTISYLLSKGLLFPFSRLGVCSESLRRASKNLRCTGKNCRKRISILKHSFFSDMKLELTKNILRDI